LLLNNVNTKKNLRSAGFFYNAYKFGRYEMLVQEMLGA